MMKMRTLRGWMGSYIYGKALGCFYKGEYRDTVRLMEKARRLDPTLGEHENYHSVMGRTQLALGDHERALQHLHLAYQSYTEGSKTKRSDFDESEYVATLKAYSNALHKTGEVDRSLKIVRELEGGSQSG